MNNKDAVTKFNALASELRLEIIKLLVKFGEDGLVAGEISTQLNIPPNNLSFHLKALVHANLVGVEQEGRFLRYRAHTASLMGLVDYLMEECCNKQTKPKTVNC